MVSEQTLQGRVPSNLYHSPPATSQWASGDTGKVKGPGWGLGRAVFEKDVFEKRGGEGRAGPGRLRPGFPSQLTNWLAVIAWVGH